jgi:hypothetical protein
VSDSSGRLPSIDSGFLLPHHNAAALRIGILANTRGLPAYAASIVASFQQATFIEVVRLIVVCAPDAAPAPKSLYRHLVAKLEQCESPSDDDPLAPVPFPTELGTLPLFEVQTLKSGDIALSEHEAGVLRADHLDVLLDFSSTDVRGDWTAVAHHGLWRFNPGNSELDRGWPFLARELLEGDPLTAIELVRVGAHYTDDRVLSRIEYSSSPYPSIRKNATAPYWGARHLFLQLLQDLHRFGSGYLSERSVASRRRLDPAHRREPPLRNVVGWIGTQMMRRGVRKILRKPCGLTWKLAIRNSDVPLFRQPDGTALGEFRWLENPPGHFWADPFLITKDGDTWLFFEDMDDQAGFASIACGLVTETGELREVRPALTIGSHLSYPQIIEADGQLFMIPETAATGGVDLYRARRFPDDWVFEKRLLNFPAVDSTIFRHAGTWWMCTSPMAVPSHAPITWLFRADSILGPWHHDPAGPVSLSAACARGAGNVLFDSGALLRPSQDCAISYGRALIFNRVDNLEGRYAEHEMARVEPGWKANLIGVHTYNRSGHWEVIDGQFAV